MAADEFVVEQAERRHARLRFALTGVSGGGKTASALLVARGIVEEALALDLITGDLKGKIGLVDTERRSASLYSHIVPFDVVNLAPPYSVERYAKAMAALERAGVYVLIIDSISHAWASGGGVLELLNAIEEHKQFRAFGTVVNPAQDKFVDRMLSSPCHVIVTMRQKTQWVMEQVEKKGRLVMAPKRVGLAPVQRPGIEYEFTTLLGLESGTNRASVIKNRCSVFDGWQPAKLTTETGRALLRWMQEGAPESASIETGTPAERARAVCDAHLRSFERATNKPDLSALYPKARAELYAFKDSVEQPVLAGMFEELKAGVGRREAALSGRPGEELLSEDDVGEIEGQMDLSGVALPLFLDWAQVARVEDLPISRKEAALTWLREQDVEPVGAQAPVAAAAAKRALGRLEDMEDDIPF